MKVQIEVEICKETFDVLDRLGKLLKLKGARGVLEQELQEAIERFELWNERFGMLSAIQSL